MWHTQMLNQVMMLASPEMVSIQLKACARVSGPAAQMKQNRPMMEARMMGDERPAVVVNVSQDFGRLTAVCEGGERARETVGGRVADREDRGEPSRRS